jgi:hypothetical protein
MIILFAVNSHGVLQKRCAPNPPATIDDETLHLPREIQIKAHKSALLRLGGLDIGVQRPLLKGQYRNLQALQISYFVIEHVL